LWSTRRWLVFDGDGILAAGVDTREGFEPHAVREDRVWGVFKDELDVESVRAYEVASGERGMKRGAAYQPAAIPS
jgi:hypothetical protein